MGRQVTEILKNLPILLKGTGLLAQYMGEDLLAFIEDLKNIELNKTKSFQNKMINFIEITTEFENKLRNFQLEKRYNIYTNEISSILLYQEEFDTKYHNHQKRYLEYNVLPDSIKKYIKDLKKPLEDFMADKSLKSKDALKLRYSAENLRYGLVHTQSNFVNRFMYSLSKTWLGKKIVTLFSSNNTKISQEHRESLDQDKNSLSRHKGIEKDISQNSQVLISESVKKPLLFTQSTSGNEESETPRTKLKSSSKKVRFKGLS